jgi:hypothetical protein
MMVPFVAVHESPNGTFKTCRWILRMSVYWGRPEVSGQLSKRRFGPQGTSTDRMAVDDYAAFGSRLSIRLRSASKSMGLVSSASAPPANAFRSVSASP